MAGAPVRRQENQRSPRGSPSNGLQIDESRRLVVQRFRRGRAAADEPVPRQRHVRARQVRDRRRRFRGGGGEKPRERRERSKVARGRVERGRVDGARRLRGPVALRGGKRELGTRAALFPGTRAILSLRFQRGGERFFSFSVVRVRAEAPLRQELSVQRHPGVLAHGLAVGMRPCGGAGTYVAFDWREFGIEPFFPAAAARGPRSRRRGRCRQQVVVVVFGLNVGPRRRRRAGQRERRFSAVPVIMKNALGVDAARAAAGPFGPERGVGGRAPEHVGRRPLGGDLPPHRAVLRHQGPVVVVHQLWTPGKKVRIDRRDAAGAAEEEDGGGVRGHDGLEGQWVHKRHVGVRANNPLVALEPPPSRGDHHGRDGAVLVAFIPPVPRNTDVRVGQSKQRVDVGRDDRRGSCDRPPLRARSHI
mmetsp:Transcript_13958/g.43269  ORF Transcript_13958/g.43269 Transcript_13958/m.43269 type:complete len:418 (+) Transcript_13958:149-1402(+)